MPSIFNHSSNVISVKYAKQILEDALRQLNFCEDTDEIELKTNTAYVKPPFLATSYGYISLKNIGEYVLSDDYDDSLEECKKPSKKDKKQIKESKNPYREIMEWADVYIEDQNRNDIPGFYIDILRDCAKGLTKPPYRKIIDGILAYDDLNISDEAHDLLMSYYPTNTSEGAKMVRDAIDDAIIDFVSGYESYFAHEDGYQFND